MTGERAGGTGEPGEPGRRRGEPGSQRKLEDWEGRGPGSTGSVRERRGARRLVELIHDPRPSDGGPQARKRSWCVTRNDWLPVFGRAPVQLVPSRVASNVWQFATAAVTDDFPENVTTELLIGNAKG